MLSQGGPYYTQMHFNWTCVGVLMKVYVPTRQLFLIHPKGAPRVNCHLHHLSYTRQYYLLRPHKPLPNKSICWLAPWKQSTTNFLIMHHVGNMLHVTFSSSPTTPFHHLSCHTSYWQIPNNEHYCLQKQKQIFIIWNSAKWHNMKM
jgi:hypothetical protein